MITTKVPWQFWEWEGPLFIHLSPRATWVCASTPPASNQHLQLLHFTCVHRHTHPPLSVSYLDDITSHSRSSRRKLQIIWAVLAWARLSWSWLGLLNICGQVVSRATGLGWPHSQFFKRLNANHSGGGTWAMHLSSFSMLDWIYSHSSWRVLNRLHLTALSFESSFNHTHHSFYPDAQDSLPSARWNFLFHWVSTISGVAGFNK